MTNILDKETFKVPEGYEMAGTEFQISDIDVNDHPDGSGDGILTYELYHDEDVDSDKLGKIVSQVILDALKRQIKEKEGSVVQPDRTTDF
jgi:hypothetical protein